MKINNTQLITILLLAFITTIACTPRPTPFDGSRALADVEKQLSFGPRTPGSEGHTKTVEWIKDELVQSGWEVENQTARLPGGITAKNIIGMRGSGEPWIILGAHYDTRISADKEPDIAKRSLPVPGANDGASGVAVLLELARTLPKDLPFTLWLVFFDAEDNGGLDGMDWVMGSSAFVEQLKGKPDGVVILDMIGDADLNIYYEKYSTPDLAAEIWKTAADLGYQEEFIPMPKHTILDDHVPFLEAGIPAVDIIDFEYPYHHTTQDTLDKVSAESLEIVGRTITAWLTKLR